MVGETRNKKYGDIMNVPFPNVSPIANSDKVVELARNTASRLKVNGNDAVLVQGEMTLTFALVSILRSLGIACVTVCSERKVTEAVEFDGSTKKLHHLNFAGSASTLRCDY